MPVAYPQAAALENTAEQKLVLKALVDIFNNHSKEGERHEISFVKKSIQGSFIAAGYTFKINSPNQFSRDLITKANITHGMGGDLTADFFKKKFHLLGGIGSNSQIKNGANEIDSVIRDDQGQRIAVIECKSGGAGSRGSQTSSYAEVCYELSMANAGYTVFFVHCYDDDATHKPNAAYMYNVLNAIVYKNHATMPANQQFINPYLSNHGSNQSDITGFITLYNVNRPPAPGANPLSTSPADHASSLASILEREFRIVVCDANVPPIPVLELNRYIAKCIGTHILNQFVTEPGPRQFWSAVKEALESLAV